ncbi:hypothetical protein OSB04_002531 [Centaurea solstitialis]|uniref:SWIM-type domain-containing protein n=1 Tax=Centaurea solstitialis TaxID=347529 RepID=A0AA38TT63_9ASTR|nr:hypothetical protein OSB04_002531 [Centaurea solstitialis]
MKRIVKVTKVMDKADGPLTLTATDKLNKIKEKTSGYDVLWGGGPRFEVVGPWEEHVVVDVVQRTCTCRRWELSGIPCKHAVAVNWNMALNAQQVDLPETWVHPTYWLTTWKDMYSFKVEPINGRAYWPKSGCPTTLVAPNHHKQIGRPKKKKERIPRFLGPFTILEKVGLQAYRLELPPEMDGIHPTFHVCYLRKCLDEEESVIPLSEIQVDTGNRCVEEPEAILGRKTKKLRHKEVAMVKVQWKHHRGANVTWEAEEDMKRRYSRLFT